MQGGAAAFADAVAAVGIFHEVHGLAQGDQPVEQPLRALEVHVVVARAVHHQQTAAQPLGVADRRGGVIGSPALLRVAHVALLVNRVVQPLVGHRRDAHADLIDVRIPEQRLQRARSAAAPTPDRDPRGVEVGPGPRERAHGIGLLVGREYSDLPVHHFAPGPAFGRRRAAVVHAGDDVAQVRDHVVPQLARPAPPLRHRRAGGLAVHVHQHRVGPGGIEIARPDHPAVERGAVGKRDLEEFCGAGDQRSHGRLERHVRDERPDHLTARQAHQLGGRGRIECGIEVERPAGVGGDDVAMHPDLGDGAHAFRLAAAVEPRTVHIALRRVVGSSGVIEPPSYGVHGVHEQDVERARRDRLDGPAVARHEIHVSPPVALAGPQELCSPREPLQIVHHVEPGAVPLGEHRAHGAARGVRQQHAIGILEPVHALQHELLGSRPFHARQVVVPRVAVDLQPRGGAAVRAHDARRDRGIGRPRLGVLDRDGVGVEGVGVVDQRESAHASHVEVPIGELRAVGGPAEAVPQVELLLVDPVRHTVDVQRVGPRGEPGDLPVGHALDVEIALADVRHAVAPRRELGVHECGLRRLAAELLERATAPVEHPVVAAGILTPHTASVREQQQLVAVSRPDVVVEVERRRVAGRDELPCRHQHAAGAGGGLVADDVGRPRHAGRGLHGGIRRAVLNPAGGAEAFGREVARREDTAQRLGRRQRYLCREGGRRGQRQRHNGQCESNATHHGLQVPLATAGTKSSRPLGGKSRVRPCSAL